MQVELLADCASASAHIAAWANRSGKRSAGEHPSQAVSSSMPGADGDMQSMAQGALGAGMHLKVYTSPALVLL